MEELNDPMIRQTAIVVRELMAGQQAGHGVDHVQRVVTLSRQIQVEAGGDPQVVELAAWLHDVGDAKLHNAQERSAEFAEKILGELGANPATIRHVCHIVDNISFRKAVHPDMLTLEGKIVQDADRLDALGAVGIVRTIEFGATRGQAFYDPNAETGSTGVGHFYEKLFTLSGRMHTNAARRMAKERELFMRLFLNQYMLEVKQAEDERGQY